MIDLSQQKKDALFLVASPLQLMCAVEAIKFFEIKSYILVIKDSIESNHEQLYGLLEKFDIKDFFCVRKKLSGTFLQFVRLFYKLKSFSFQYCFMGENGTAFRSFCFSLKPNEIFLLDDGTASFQQQKDIEFSSAKHIWNSEYGKLRAYRYALVGMTLKQPKRISYFSIILEDSINSEVIIKHRLANAIEVLKLKNKNQPVIYSSKTALFLDDAFFLREGILEFDDYEWAYKKFFMLCKPPITKYFHRPHRSFKNTPQEVEVIKGLSFTIQENRSPLEIELVLNGQPGVIGGLISTGLITAKKMFPKTEVYAIDIRERLQATRSNNQLIDAFTDTYNEFVKVGIKVI